MRLKLYLLFFLLLCLRLPLQAQQLPPKVEQLRSGIAEAKQQLEQIQQQREHLRSLHAALQDSASYMAAIDSLQQKYADPQELKLQQDSLQKAFTTHQEVLRRLDEAEVSVREEIVKATEALAKELTPQQAGEALSQLEKAKSLTTELQLPQPSAGQVTGLVTPGSPEGLQEAAKNQVLEHARGYGKELSGYQERVKKMEHIKGEVQKDIFQVESLKGKPWQERLLVGTHWQFGRQERFFVDLGPYAAWRFTGRISVGTGLQYRLSVSVKEKPFVSNSDKTLGYFAFTDVEVFKGFFARLHYENLSTSVPGDVTGQVAQEWVQGLSVGFGRNYTFFKQVKGFALVQYNLMHERGKTPYLKPLQAKVGFYINGGSLKNTK